jgi:hypothetical protein
MNCLHVLADHADFRCLGSRDISVGIVTGDWLDDRVRAPVGTRIFYSYVAQNGSVAHPASYPPSTGGSSGGKAAGA